MTDNRIPMLPIDTELPSYTRHFDFHATARSARIFALIRCGCDLSAAIPNARIGAASTKQVFDFIMAKVAEELVKTIDPNTSFASALAQQLRVVDEKDDIPARIRENQEPIIDFPGKKKKDKNNGKENK